MPKTIAPLTDAQCRKLKAPENGIAQLSDGGGLTLQVSHKGKYWRLRYYFNGKREEVRLGVYPAISLREARIKREEIRQMVLQGTDPKSRKIAALDAVFETVARKWHADQTAKPDKWVPAHVKRVLRSLELHIFPAIGKKPLDCIAPLEILTLLQRLEADGKNDTAHKVYNVVNQVFKYACGKAPFVHIQPRRRIAPRTGRSQTHTLQNRFRPRRNRPPFACIGRLHGHTANLRFTATIPLSVRPPHRAALTALV